MGQKSRAKKNKTKNPVSKQHSVGDGVNTNKVRGLTLAGLERGVIHTDSSIEKVNPQNISYEMIGNLRVDIKKIFLLFIVCFVLLLSAFLMKNNTSHITTVSNKVATFLDLF